MAKWGGTGNDQASTSAMSARSANIETPMKSFRSILTDLALLATTGCIFPDNRERTEDLEPPCPYQHPPEGHPDSVIPALPAIDRDPVKVH